MSIANPWPGGPALESALPASVDRRRHTLDLARTWESVMSESKPALAPRPVVLESWKRVKRLGVDPERGQNVPVAPRAELESLRRDSGLIPVLGLLRRGLGSLADDGVHIMVISDADGRLLWREGSKIVRHHAERLGFVEGALWREQIVGTNGIATGLQVNQPVQIFAAEHFVRSHHSWVCTAAPILNPVDGTLLGVADVAGPLATAHASTLALVDSVARLACVALWQEHLAGLGRLRRAAAAVLARAGRPAVVTDRHGWVAAADGIWPGERISLPTGLQPGRVLIPALGICEVEPFPGGWFVRVGVGESVQPTVLRLHLDGHRPSLTLTGSSGDRHHYLTTRHAEILLLLATAPGGRTAAELSMELYGDQTHRGTVRAELFRLRRCVGALIEERPYRLPDWLEVSVELPGDMVTLLLRSTAPAVRRLRAAASAASAVTAVTAVTGPVAVRAG